MLGIWCDWIVLIQLVNTSLINQFFWNAQLLIIRSKGARERLVLLMLGHRRILYRSIPRLCRTSHSRASFELMVKAVRFEKTGWADQLCDKRTGCLIRMRLCIGGDCAIAYRTLSPAPNLLTTNTSTSAVSRLTRTFSSLRTAIKRCCKTAL